MKQAKNATELNTIELTAEMMDTIVDFQNAINGGNWRRLYGLAMRVLDIRVGESGDGQYDLPNHMWGKFYSHDHCISKMYCFADRKQRKVIVKMIQLWEQERLLNRHLTEEEAKASVSSPLQLSARVYTKDCNGLTGYFWECQVCEWENEAEPQEEDGRCEKCQAYHATVSVE